MQQFEKGSTLACRSELPIVFKSATLNIAAILFRTSRPISALFPFSAVCYIPGYHGSCGGTPLIFCAKSRAAHMADQCWTCWTVEVVGLWGADHLTYVPIKLIFHNNKTHFSEIYCGILQMSFDVTGPELANRKNCVCACSYVLNW